MITIDLPSSPLAVQELPSISKSGLARFLKRACFTVGLDETVEVLLTSDSELKRLNHAFRGKNKATDVLSFPAADEAQGLAGDLAVSLDMAARRAVEHRHTMQDEVKILLLHGLLHLAGEDHETDTGQMAEREAELRQKLKLPAGLIERTRMRSTRKKG